MRVQQARRPAQAASFIGAIVPLAIDRLPVDRLDTPARPAENEAVPVPRITREELKTQLEGTSAPLVLDVRLKYPYEHSTLKLPGALRMAPEAIRIEALDRHRDIVVYDSDPDDVTSARVAAELNRQGFHAAALKGGFAEWLAGNLPTASRDGMHQPAPEVPPKT